MRGGCAFLVNFQGLECSWFAPQDLVDTRIRSYLLVDLGAYNLGIFFLAHNSVIHASCDGETDALFCGRPRPAASPREAVFGLIFAAAPRGGPALAECRVLRLWGTIALRIYARLSRVTQK